MAGANDFFLKIDVPMPTNLEIPIEPRRVRRHGGNSTIIEEVVTREQDT